MMKGRYDEIGECLRVFIVVFFREFYGVLRRVVCDLWDMGVDNQSLG